MKVLVTGGAGYIGSHVSKALALAGHEPIVYDNLEMGHKWAVQWGPLVKADLADIAVLRKSLEQVEAVIHLAGYIFVGESVKAPGKYYRNNFTNSLHLLDAMVETGVKNIVFSSTAAVYGNPREIPIPEDAPKEPINPYGESKRFIEQVMEWYSSAHGMRALSLRYFNACGADPDHEIGEMHNPETHLLPLIIYASLGLRPSIQVFGTDYNTADGTCLRDYIHVTDLARAHVSGLAYLKNVGVTTACNVGTGSGHTVRELIRAVETLGGKPVPVTEGPRRGGDAETLVARATLARDLLGWQPRHSSLDEIVSTALRWHHHAIETGLHDYRA
ncbi:MAG: UDP-glucose 4-epimerase GalE [Acidobacteria bacterium]|nr:UDP-glucose 4-epimerase GalE [Acidobacteriota bacterium]